MYVASSPNSDIPPAATRLHYIDGIRACAMISVVFFHAWQLGGRWPLAIHLLHHRIPLGNFLAFGHSGVNLFLVLSGFCLFWPFATKPDRRFDLQNFALRRCWRILPPYYGALVLSVLAMFIPYFFTHIAPKTDDLPSDILWHVLMIYSFKPSYVLSINSVFWSLCLEFHLYFLFPFFLLLFKRFSPRAIIYPALVLQMLIRFALWHFYSGTSITEGFVIYYSFWGRFFEFILGMYLAHLISGWHRTKKLDVNPLDYVVILGVVVMAFISIRSSGKATIGDAWFAPITDILCGIIAAIFILIASRENSLLHRILSNKFVVNLGIISYSVYLLHMIVIKLLSGWVAQYNISGTNLMMLVDVVFIIPLCLLSGYIYHQLVERHFLKLPTRNVAVKTNILPDT